MYPPGPPWNRPCTRHAKILDNQEYSGVKLTSLSKLQHNIKYTTTNKCVTFTNYDIDHS